MLGLYRKNPVIQFLVSYLVILVFPLVMISAGFYSAFRIVESDLKNSHIDMLRHSSDIISGQLKVIESMALQAAEDEDILAYGNGVREEGDYIVTARAAADHFSMYQNYQNSQFLQDAYIYFPGRDLVLYQGTYYRPEVFERYLREWGAGSLEEWRQGTVSLHRRLPGYERSGKELEFVFPFAGSLEGDIQGIIVCRISGQAMAQSLGFWKSQGDSMVEILDDAGQILWMSDSMEENRGIPVENLLENEFVSWDGMGVVSVVSERLRWTYVMAVPERQAMEQLMILKNMVMLLLSAAILGGLGFAVFMAVRKGRPICQIFQALVENSGELYTYQNLGRAVAKLADRHHEVLKELEQEKPSMRIAFFHELLHGEFGSEEQVRLAARKVDVELGEGGCQAVSFRLFSENDIYAADDQTLDEVRILNGFLEHYLRENWKGKVWFYKRTFKTATAVFSLEGCEEDCRGLVEKARKRLLMECQTESSWGIGTVCDNLTLLWRSVEEARMALEHGDEKQPVVSYSQEIVNKNRFYLPGVAAEKLILYMTMGQWREAGELLDILEQENCAERMLSRPQFLKLCRALADILDQGHRSDVLTEEKILWLNESLMLPGIPQREYFSRYRQLVHMACTDNGEKRRAEKGKLVDEIMEYIRQHYGEADMGLTKVGTRYRLSERYLSGLFKEQSGINFGDFLEGIRIKEACCLLKENLLTVNEVAEKTGYNSVQSFRRAFKRVIGMSPKEYRNS